MYLYILKQKLPHPKTPQKSIKQCGSGNVLSRGCTVVRQFSSMVQLSKYVTKPVNKQGQKIILLYLKYAQANSPSYVWNLFINIYFSEVYCYSVGSGNQNMYDIQSQSSLSLQKERENCSHLCSFTQTYVGFRMYSLQRRIQHIA